MPRFVMRKAKQKVGLAPGTLVYVLDKKVEKVRIRIIDYDETQLEEKEVETIEECFPFKDRPTVTWINIDGLHDVVLIEKIGKQFGLHPLILEDIVHTGMTLNYILNHLSSHYPASLHVCTLLDKRVRRLIDIPLDYIGFEIPDEFVVGYGLDYYGEYRNLPFIGALNPKLIEEEREK